MFVVRFNVCAYSLLMLYFIVVMLLCFIAQVVSLPYKGADGKGAPQADSGKELMCRSRQNFGSIVLCVFFFDPEGLPYKFLVFAPEVDR